MLLGKKNMHLEDNPQQILDEIQVIVLQQQNEFARIWDEIFVELKNEKIFIVNENQLNNEQKQYVKTYFEEEVRSNVIPLLVESIPQFPYLREKSIYLGVVMRKTETAYDQKYALIEVPATAVGRFILLPSKPGEHHIILLEDVIRFNLPAIFSYFGYDAFTSHIFKVTKDAEIDLDNDISTSLIQKIEKGVKNRRKGKTVRFVYDKEMDASLLEYLIRKLNLSRRDNIIPGGRIHNYRHFMDFPDVFNTKQKRLSSFSHPALIQSTRVTDVVLNKDILLNFPYHSFNAIIDLLREAAMDPEVTIIKITAYRLASNSKVINALVNAVRNGKEVVVVLELRARFDEEANLEWKEKLEEEGVKVLIVAGNLKVHAKLLVIKKQKETRTIYYGFVSTGNLNEQTSKVYSDHCLLTSNRDVMADVNRIFRFFENPKHPGSLLEHCKTLMVCPNTMRSSLNALINREIKNAKAKRPAYVILKLNSLSDKSLIEKLYEAADAGVELNIVVRGIFCAAFDKNKIKKQVKSISIVDEYLEHARVMIFCNSGKEKVYISSADWMVRNLDHRVEAAVPIMNKGIKKELMNIMQIQLNDNVKARWLDDKLRNKYIETTGKRTRSQVEIHKYLFNKLTEKLKKTIEDE
jgi:polyphosphate kinase